MFRVSYNILGRRWKHFSQLLNIRWANVVRQKELHTAEPLVPERRDFGFEMAIGMLKGHKSQGIDQIPGDLTKEGGKTFKCFIYKLANTIWNKDELPKVYKDSIIIRMTINETVVTIETY